MARRKYELVVRTGHPDFLDLPLTTPLGRWRVARLTRRVRGLSRHIVRFVAYDDRVYAFKEMEEPLVTREYRLLREIEDRALPAVDPVGYVSGRVSARGTPLPGLLITRFLDFSLPYRHVFAHGTQPPLLVDALAVLLVRLHIEGIYWGDCSLSNALFLRDAGELEAFLVDAETAEAHPQLSPGQRDLDLLIATDNVAGGLLDLAAAGMAPELDPGAIGEMLLTRYHDLWSELTQEEVIDASERWRVDQRMRRVNELGFDVTELVLAVDGPGPRLRMRPRIVEEGHHRRRLRELTGLDVHPKQARRLLADIEAYRACLAGDGPQVPEGVGAYRWLTEVFEPAIKAIPPDLLGRLEPAEAFHQILEHRWLLSEAHGRDVGTDAAVASYVSNVLPYAPGERLAAFEVAAP